MVSFVTNRTMIWGLAKRTWSKSRQKMSFLVRRLFLRLALGTMRSIEPGFLIQRWAKSQLKAYYLQASDIGPKVDLQGLFLDYLRTGGLEFGQKLTFRDRNLPKSQLSVDSWSRCLLFGPRSVVNQNLGPTVRTGSKSRLDTGLLEG
jgi:hypothetical protein